MENYGSPILGVMLLNDSKSKAITELDGSPYKGVAFLDSRTGRKSLGQNG